MIKEKDILSNALKMKTLYFKKIEFKATGKKASDEGMANVAFDEKHDITDKTIDIDLFCKVEVENVFVLELCLNGTFEAGNIESKGVLPNAIAIMFPYLRAQVSLMTAQPNIPTISLKPVNINALLEKQREQEE